MRRHKQVPSLASYGLAVNATVIVLLSLFMVICGIGAWAGLDAVRRNQPVDLMGPAWFVASGLGFVLSALLIVALVASMIADRLHAARKRSDQSDRTLRAFF